MLKRLALDREGVGLRTRIAVRRESRRWDALLAQNDYAAAIFRRYIESLCQKFPRITGAQEISFAAALEDLGRKSCGETVTEEEIGEIYRVTKPRLKNAITKLQPFVGAPEETE